MRDKAFLPTPDALLIGKKEPDLVEVPARLVLATSLDLTGRLILP